MSEDVLATLPAPVQQFVAAINSGDTEAFVGVFTADGYVDDWGRVLRGPDGVRSWAGSDAIGAGAQMTILSGATEGDTVHTHFSWSSSVFNGESDGIFTLDGDKIAGFRIPPAH
ncbi:nuclear transport factor 2 family protein [Ruania albidiflava]|uniref:nuclear transport factor 2 family protein n=1 Tax=Ruania albidiflava TaxID=366586 RepID=UPI0003B73B06|nr:nuclear transport factor 2 family protein [Ruania albidiflava]HLS64543.1 nuclear transport factor 2 family protein [Ruania sp.]